MIKICSICQEKYEGFGNNAQPVNNGRSCDNCEPIVITARFRRFARGEPMRRVVEDKNDAG